MHKSGISGSWVMCAYMYICTFLCTWPHVCMSIFSCIWVWMAKAIFLILLNLVQWGRISLTTKHTSLSVLWLVSLLWRSTVSGSYVLGLQAVSYIYLQFMLALDLWTFTLMFVFQVLSIVSYLFKSLKDPYFSFVEYVLILCFSCTDVYVLHS